MDSNASLLRSEIAVVSNTSTVIMVEPASDHCDVRITSVSVSITCFLVLLLGMFVTLMK